MISDLPKKIIDKLSHIRLFVMDVDGTLTDGSMYYTEHGDTMKRFYVQDGMGIARLPSHNIQTCFMTSENNKIISSRAEKLKITHLIMGTRAKKRDLQALVEKCSLTLDEVAYIGDDINDEQAMSISGLSFCPNDAHPRILQKADHIAPFPGGRGAVRYVADLLLEAQGHALFLQDDWK